MSITADYNLKNLLAFASKQLSSPGDGKQGNIRWENKSSIKIRWTQIDHRGHLADTGVVDANSTSDKHQVREGDFYLITTRRTGAYMRVYQIKETSDDGKKLAINTTDLLPPDFIGPPPLASNSEMLPGSSPTVVVGVSDSQDGNKGNDFIILHEQAWRPAHGSYSLSPGEKKQISYQVTRGVNIDKETAKTIADMTGGQGGGSLPMGLLSAQISASLTSTSQSSTSVALSEQSTSTEVQMFDNSSGSDTLLLQNWELVDSFVWMKAADKDPLPIASFTSRRGLTIPIANRLKGKEITLSDGTGV